MIKTEATNEKIHIFCDFNTLLTEYSFSIEQALMWFYGQGVFKFNVWKSGPATGGIDTLIKNLNCPQKPFMFGSVALLADLQNHGFLPSLFLNHEIWKVENKVDFIEHGNLQITLGEKETSIVMIGYHESTNSISQLAYDLSDLIISILMFCNEVKVQTSVNMSQVIFNKVFNSSDDVKNFIDFKLNYSIKDKIDLLFKER